MHLQKGIDIVDRSSVFHRAVLSSIATALAPMRMQKYSSVLVRMKPDYRSARPNNSDVSGMFGNLVLVQVSLLSHLSWEQVHVAILLTCCLRSQLTAYILRNPITADE
jgi:hypothetical protein